MTTSPAATTAEIRLAHAAAFLSLLCSGLYVTALGPALPFIADGLGVSLGATGLLITLLFGGSITASGAVALWLHRFDARLTGAAGLAAAAAALVILALAASWPAYLAAAALLGAGDGLIAASSHNLVAATADDVPHAITRLNVFYALGAILGPLWSGAMLSATGERAIVFGGIAAAVAAVAATMLLASRGELPAVAPERGRASPLTRLAWVMGGVLFLYIGAEIGLGSWVSSYSRQAAGAGVMAGAAVTAGYWGALAAGRILTGALFARGHDAGALLLLSIAGAGVASAVLALAGGTLTVGAAAAFATGLCLGPIWPVAMAIGARGARSGAPSALVTVGNAGGLLFPWLQGLVLASAGPSEGITITVGLCIAMLACAAASRSPFFAGPA